MKEITNQEGFPLSLSLGEIDIEGVRFILTRRLAYLKQIGIKAVRKGHY